LLFDILIQSEDRHPSNMLFKLVSWNTNEAPIVSDRFFVDFGASGLSRASGSFMDFPNSVSEKEIVNAIVGTRARTMDQSMPIPKILDDIVISNIKGGVVNEAYWSVIEDYQVGGELISVLAKSIEAITNEQIVAIVKEAHLPNAITGKGVIEDKWIPQLEAELFETGVEAGARLEDATNPWKFTIKDPSKGFWNRKALKLKKDSLAMLNNILKKPYKGDVQQFMIETIISRRDSLIACIDGLKSSSGGTILQSRAEKISAVHRNVKESDVIRERFDKAIAEFDSTLDIAAASEAKKLFKGIRKEIRKKLDNDIMQILADPDLAISPDDKAALKDMEKAFYQAEQYIRNIEAIMYANDGRLAENETLRVMILPETAAVSKKVLIARGNEVVKVQENIGVITIASDKPLKVIEDIKSGKMLFEHQGAEIAVPAKNIAVLLTENKKDMVSKINNAIGANNTFVISDIGNSQHVPVSQLAILTKIKLILNELDISSQEAGPYRSAFLAIWKSVTGNTLPGTIEDFMNNPADYIISILIAPESLLDDTEREALYNMAAEIWA